MEREEFIRLLYDYVAVTLGRRLAEHRGVSLGVVVARGTEAEPIIKAETCGAHQARMVA